jgi:hypothetical protein
MRLPVLTLACCLLIAGCGGAAELSSIRTTDAALAALQEAGFTCDDPEISEAGEEDGNASGYIIIDCERYAMDLIDDVPAWEAQFTEECSFLSSPEQREVLGEVDIVFGADWLIRSRDYGSLVQWQPGATPADFARELGGRAETWADTCERLGGWD